MKTYAPVAEIREAYNTFFAYPKHFFYNKIRPVSGLQGLVQYHVIVGFVGIFHKSAVNVALNYGQAFLNLQFKKLMIKFYS